MIAAPRPKFSTFSEILPLYQYIWLPVTLRSPSPLTINFKSQSACTFQFMCKNMEDLDRVSDGGGQAELRWLTRLSIATSILATDAWLWLVLNLPFPTYYQLFRNRCVTKFEVYSCSSLSHSISGFVLVPCGRLSWLLPAFDRTLISHPYLLTYLQRYFREVKFYNRSRI